MTMYEERHNHALLYLILAAALIGLVLYLRPNMDPGKQRAVAGIREPLQTEAHGSEQLTIGGYDLTFTYLYNDDIEALVIGTHNYSGVGIGDKLAPKDVALAWGKVAEYNTKIDFHWDQSNRWYYWKVDNVQELAPLGSVNEVGLHSANNHLIATDSATRKAIKRIKVGDHIRLTGYLVNIDGHSGSRTFFWHSSTSRADTGNGSCEVFYVKSVEWLD